MKSCWRTRVNWRNTEGRTALREEGLLDSALAKPKNVFASADEVSLARLAASYAFGIARNHPFVDGNERTALVASEGFLRFNGHRVEAAPEDKYLTFLSLAEGSLSEAALADWLEQHLQPIKGL